MVKKHYKTIKDTTKHTQFSIATLRENVEIFLTFAPPPHPKGGPTPLSTIKSDPCLYLHVMVTVRENKKKEIL